jgi:predicted transcriptional regulator
VGCKTEVIISLRDEYVTQVLNGKKTVELRRRMVNIPAGSRVWIYTKSPTASVTLCATVERVFTGSPREIWRDHKDAVGITRTEFDAYLGDVEIACAIVLKDVRSLAPAPKLHELRLRSANFHPPQFFKRFHDEDKTLALLRSRVMPG